MTSKIVSEPTLSSIAASALPIFLWAAPEAIDVSKIRDVKNIYSQKPLGGLWLSPKRESGLPVWIDWLETYGVGLYSDRSSDFIIQEVSVKDDARILLVDSWDDFAKILSRYLLIRDDLGDNPFELPTYYLDFEAIAQDWDAIYLTETGQVATRNEPGKSWIESPNLFTWDLESMIILNKEVVSEINTLDSYKLKNVSTFNR